MITASCTTCANEPSQAALEWVSQDVYDMALLIEFFDFKILQKNSYLLLYFYPF